MERRWWKWTEVTKLWIIIIIIIIYGDDDGGGDDADDHECKCIIKSRILLAVHCTFAPCILIIWLRIYVHTLRANSGSSAVKRSSVTSFSVVWVPGAFGDRSVGSVVMSGTCQCLPSSATGFSSTPCRGSMRVILGWGGILQNGCLSSIRTKNNFLSAFNAM
jgi:hypothetical protein